MEPELEDVLRALGASKLDIMIKVGIPRTQPYLFGSLKVAITLAFVGTVVSETIGANAGLGYLIVLAGSNFQMPLVFAGAPPARGGGHRHVCCVRVRRAAISRAGRSAPR